VIYREVIEAGRRKIEQQNMDELLAEMG